MNFKRLFSVLSALLLSVSVMMAQSSGDKLYNQGLQLQKTMTVQAQNNAISKFTSAKKLYDSAAKKAQCDNAISVSRNIISSLKSGGSNTKSNGSKKKNNQTAEPEQKEEPITLSLTNKEFSLDNETKALSVGVTSNKNDWSVSTVACANGSSFLTAAKSSADKIIINVPANYTTETRTQDIQVKAGTVTENITITQTGKPINLDATVKDFSFKEKGGKKKFIVTCNATQQYPDNGHQNWYVESKPKWVTIELNQKRDKGTLGNFFGKIGDGVNGLINGSDSDNGNGIKTNVTLICDPLVKGSVDAHNGHKGEVVLRSGDQTVILKVSQFGKVSVIPD